MTTEGPLLVIAGAGSGKTRTLTYRVARLVELGVPPSTILLLTFSRKAAQQMQQRAANLLDRRCEKVSGGTFHSFGNMILRKYAPLLGFDPGFAILDRVDAESLIGILRKETHAATKQRSFPRKHTLANIFSRAVNKILPIEDAVYDDYPHLTAYLEPIISIFHAYKQHKCEHNFFDFDDLLLYLQQLLSQHPDIRDRISSSYSYIMVDEYQDTNKIQELCGQGIALNQMAVLFRAGYHSFDLEIELNRDQIPFIKVGGFKFVESAHIKDVLAHLRVISNPNDRISWYRILLLIDKIGPATARIVYEAIKSEAAGYTGLLAMKSKKSSVSGLQRLKDLFSAIAAYPMPLAEMGAAVIEYYLPILKERYDDHPKRAKDLEQLHAIMERYGQLEQFLTDMALEPPNTSIGDTFSVENPADDRLVLSTVHSAKGLEWHTVFIIWALDGRFPSSQSLFKEEDLEEELRLMYVAATRARENLFFIYPNQVYDRSMGVMLNRPSRFIDLMPKTILEKQFARY